MSQDPRNPLQAIRKMLPYTTAAACLALIYAGWVFYARWSQDRELQRKADEKSVEQAQKTYELYGSGQLKILLFYASPAVIRRGETTELCYSVANATTLKMNPSLPDVRPSLNRCLKVTPARSITYTLAAGDDKGHSATQSVNVVVR